ncbi:MAG: hypothetical protein ACREBW_08580 [Candidatus Micrarchaeaceae archaeon]
MPQDSKIDNINEQDIHNYEQVKALLGEAALLPDDVAKLYSLHQQIIGEHLATKGQKIASFLLHGVCLRHLVLGTLSLFRIHTSQIFQETRMALEASATAYAILHDEEKLKIFLADTGGDDKTRRAAKKAFKPENIFPYDHPLLKQLSNSYNLAAQVSHTNLLSLARHFGDRQRKTVRFVFQDVPEASAKVDLPRYLDWLLAAHLTILALADQIFESVACDLATFKKERLLVYQRCGRLKVTHDQAISKLEQLSKSP